MPNSLYDAYRPLIVSIEVPYSIFCQAWVAVFLSGLGSFEWLKVSSASNAVQFSDRLQRRLEPVILPSSSVCIALIMLIDVKQTKPNPKCARNLYNNSLVYL